MKQTELMKILPSLLNTVVNAGNATMEVYQKAEPDIKYKQDNSPVTEADLLVNELITAVLLKLTPNIPIISEEALVDYETRKNFSDYWLIDPIDGTKEFIKKTGEFTINVGYVKDGVPLFGVIYVPVSRYLYFGGLLLNKAYRTYIVKDGLFWSEHKPVQVTSWKHTPTTKDYPVKITCSKDHKSEYYDAFITNFIERVKHIKEVPCGSTIKIAQIAEGKADIYVRLSGINDWDLAAGHAIVLGAGGSVMDINRKRLEYNTESQRLNPFVITGPNRLPWYQAIPELLMETSQKERTPPVEVESDENAD